MALTIKAARINAGYTQKEASKKLGIATTTLSSYENGDTFPKEPVIKKLEELYGVTYNQLIFLPCKSD